LPVDSRKVLPSRLAFAAGFALVAGWVGCSFPERTFIDDSEFYNTAGVGAVGGGGTGATGGGGTDGGGTGATDGGGTGATGGGTGNEDCTNGVDDDGDSKVDCEDTDCQTGFTCAPVTPTGWTGPVAFYEGTDAPPDCLNSGGYPTLKQNAKSGLDGGTATCPTCSCDPPTGATCSGDIYVYNQTNCTGNQWAPTGGGPTATISTADTCKNFPNLCYDNTSKPQGARLQNVVFSGGTCQAKSTGQKTIPTATWTNSVRACGDAPGSGAGCGTGVCLPRPSAPFGSSLCIFKLGDTACPAPFSTKKLSNLNFTDNRDCEVCGCGNAAGGSCSNPVATLYTDSNGCTATAQTITGEGTCIALTADPDPNPSNPNCPTTGDPAETRAGKFSATPTGGTCPTTGGTVTGAATATEPVTFCCL